MGYKCDTNARREGGRLLVVVGDSCHHSGCTGVRGLGAEGLKGVRGGRVWV